MPVDSFKMYFNAKNSFSFSRYAHFVFVHLHGSQFYGTAASLLLVPICLPTSVKNHAQKTQDLSYVFLVRSSGN